MLDGAQRFSYRIAQFFKVNASGFEMIRCKDVERQCMPRGSTVCLSALRLIVPHLRLGPASRKFSATKAGSLALIVVFLSGGLSCYLPFYRTDLAKGLAAFAKAYKSGCVTEARISAIDAPPCPSYRGEGKASVDDVERDRAKESLLDAVSEHHSGGSPENALGQFYLAEGDLDRAIDHLKKAIGFDAGNARFHSDFAAALLDKGITDSARSDPDANLEGSGQGLEEIANGLDEAEKAVRINPSLPEALFNRALGCQHLTLWNEAEKAWQTYLEKDSGTKWSELAKQNLKLARERQQRTSTSGKELFQEFVRAYKAGDKAAAFRALSQANDQTGNAIASELIDSFLLNGGNGPDAKNSLMMLKYAGKVHKDQTKDAYLYDLSRYYGRTTPSQRRLVADARSAMVEAYGLFTKSQLDQAISNYTKAKATFLSAGDVSEAIMADFWTGHCYTIQPNTETAPRIINKVSYECQRNHYRDLQAQCLYDLANIQTDFFKYTIAVGYSVQSVTLLREIGNVKSVERSTLQLAEEYRELKDARASLGVTQQVLSLASETNPEDLQRWQISSLLAFNLASIGLDGAAMNCWKEGVSAALKMGRPLITSRTYEYLGVEYAKLKLYDKAIAAGSAALDIGNQVGNEPNGLNIAANSCLILGNICRQSGDYEKAIQFYDRSSIIYANLGLELYDYPVHKGKALAYIAQGDDTAAEIELNKAIALAEQFRSKIRDQSRRDVFFDSEQDIYDVAIDFQFSKKHDIEKAYSYSEQSRARSFLDLLKSKGRVEEDEKGLDIGFSSTARPFSFADIVKEVPEQAQIVQYAVLADKVVISLVSKRGLVGRSKEIPQGDLDDKVASYLRLLSVHDPEKDAELGSLARQLYDILISPIESLLDQDKQICIVPDKVLNYLPFAALVSPTTGAYTIETYKILYSPSSTVFEVCSNEAVQRMAHPAESLLAVANPTFDPAAFSHLRDLPDADREVRAIKNLYDLPVTLTGKAADKAAVLRRLGGSDVVHLATHTVIDESAPLRTKLLAARREAPESTGTADDSAIEPADVYQLKLTRPRLVVISSCSSAIERYYRGEGAISLVRPFLVAGVPLVVASLWKVDSAATARLMIAFHKHRKLDGARSVDALRSAQLELIGERGGAYANPFYWAPFAAYGGYARF
jgi:CHAT domain-containing protein/tetratricopeptide (TPR) repeat protein